MKYKLLSGLYAQPPEAFHMHGSYYETMEN